MFVGRTKAPETRTFLWSLLAMRTQIVVCRGPQAAEFPAPTSGDRCVERALIAFGQPAEQFTANGTSGGLNLQATRAQARFRRSGSVTA
jgi:hypothetical protein